MGYRHNDGFGTTMDAIYPAFNCKIWVILQIKWDRELMKFQLFLSSPDTDTVFLSFVLHLTRRNTLRTSLLFIIVREFSRFLRIFNKTIHENPLWLARLSSHRSPRLKRISSFSRERIPQISFRIFRRKSQISTNIWPKFFAHWNSLCHINVPRFSRHRV